MYIKLENEIEIEGSKVNAIDIAVKYNKGGMNYFNYKEEKRGLYLYVRGVKLDGSSVSFMMFGNKLDFKAFLAPMGRDNKKKVAGYNDKLAAVMVPKDIIELYKAGAGGVIISYVKNVIGLAEAA